MADNKQDPKGCKEEDMPWRRELADADLKLQKPKEIQKGTDEGRQAQCLKYIY
jgi:hypothetical protein